MSTRVKKKESVQAKLEISEEALLDIAITAVEGGIGYWSFIENYDYQNPDNIGTLSPSEDEDEFAPTILNVKTILKGIKRILKGNVKIGNDIRQSILYAIVSDDMGDIDSQGADCIVQVGMFNQIVYG